MSGLTALATPLYKLACVKKKTDRKSKPKNREPARAKAWGTKTMAKVMRHACMASHIAVELLGEVKEGTQFV